MGTFGKIVGAVSVVTGAAGAVAASGVTAQRRAVRRYRELAASPDIHYDTLTADRTYSVASADGLALHVEEVGPTAAPLTVIFAHGWTLRLGAWHYQRIALSGNGFGTGSGPEARLVFFDQRSHGRSGRADPGRSTVTAVSEDLAAVIATAAPTGPLVIVGHSLGGMALLGLAETDPALFYERVVGYALMDSSARYGSEKGSRPPLLGGNPVVRAVTATASRYPRLFERGRPATREAVWLLTRSFGFADPDVPTHLVDYVDEMISSVPVDVIADFIPAIIGHDVRAGVRVLADLPGLILCGEADRITPPVQSWALAEALPDAELLIVAGAGHNVMLENPQVVNAALQKLLQLAGIRAGLAGIDDPDGVVT
jgi:pimeloyl-ACP methyl ester carboxylesterase